VSHLTAVPAADAKSSKLPEEFDLGFTAAAIGVIRVNHGVGLSVLAERSRRLRRHEGFGGEALDAVRQGCPVDFFAIFVGHPNEAPGNLMGASVASQLSRQLIGMRLCVECLVFMQS
jgi:hypothetical protein